MSGIGTLEQTAVSRIHNALPIFGRGFHPFAQSPGTKPLFGQEHADDHPTDATGLSRSQESIQSGLAALEHENTSRSAEMTYLAAGARSSHSSRSHQAGRNAPESNASLIAAAGTQQPLLGASDITGTRGQQGLRPQTTESLTPTDALAASMQTQRSRPIETPGSDDAARQPGNNDAEKEGSGPQQNLSKELSTDEQEALDGMKKRDKEVRTHEQAHLSASGGLALGGPSYQQERGPDGRMYAVAGEVNIDTSEGSSPEETIAKAQRIRTAALAPAQPSGQDRQVAAQASQMEAAARQDQSSGSSDGGSSDGGSSDGGSSDGGSSDNASAHGLNGVNAVQNTQTADPAKLDPSDPSENPAHAVATAAHAAGQGAGSGAGSPTGRLAMVAEQARAAYSRATGETGMTAFTGRSNGVSFAV